MENEIWKDIPDYEGLYQASNKGRIRTSENKTTFTQRHGVRRWKQRILKPKVKNYKTGYRVALWKNGKPKDFLVARLVATTFLGKSDLTVNHIDGNRFNNNIENLEWVSRRENIQKGFETGLYPQYNVILFNKKTSEETFHLSMVKASKYMGRAPQYLGSCLERNKTENEEYSWKIIPYKPKIRG